MTNTTQDLVTEIVQALTLIFQKHLQNVSNKQQLHSKYSQHNKKPTLAKDSRSY